MGEWIINLIERMGYLGIALLMFLENLFPPIPSELRTRRASNARCVAVAIQAGLVSRRRSGRRVLEYALTRYRPRLVRIWQDLALGRADTRPASIA